MNAKVKVILEKHNLTIHKDKLERDSFEYIIRDAVSEDVLEELLEVMLQANIMVPVDIVTACLCERYIPNWRNLNEEERRKKLLHANHTINKNQIAIFKTLL